MKKAFLIFFLTQAVFILQAQVACNITPVAIAGNDTTIQNGQTSCTPVPVTITLNGSNSFDPDGIIVSYLWSGSDSISNPNSVITTVTGLFPGNYSFILKVTDNYGAFAFDTVDISIVPANRPLIPARLIQIATVPESRWGMTFVSAGNKIVFAGGDANQENGCVTDRVDIFDIPTGTWTTAQLSQARFGIGTAVLGNKIFFAGGIIPLPGPPGAGCIITNWENTRTSTVDIYDVSANTWSVAQLSLPRVVIGSVTGNKIVFPGNEQLVWTSNNRVDIYDGGTNSWSIDSLSFTRRILAATVIGNKCFFAGGEYDPDGLTNNIDIYDASSNTWTLDHFSTPFVQSWAPSGIAVGNKNYWAGGWYSGPGVWMDVTNHVEIRDEVTHTSTFDCLFEAKLHFGIVQKDNKLVFFTGEGWFPNEKNKFDIYDITNNTWSIGVLPVNIYGSSIISVNNTIYVAGGYVNGVLSNHVWKLEIDSCTNSSSSTITTSACDTYTLNGQTYRASGVYTQTLVNAVGCDSIITLNLTVNYSTNCITSVTACNSYTWHGQTYTVSGFYSDTLVSSNNCDSIINLNLTINYTVLTTINATICEGQSYAGYTIAGTYIDTLLASNGCDSIRTLILSVNPRSYSNIIAIICEGQNYGGHTLTGIYIDTLVAANGCDSIRTLNLTVKPRSFSSINAIICEGQNYEGHTSTGIYIDTLVAANGCDSIRTLNLTVKPKSFSTITITICQGQNYGGHTLAGIYIDTLVAANGCDSIRTLNLTVKPKSFTSINAIICEGQNYAGHTSAGTYIDTLVGINGCDSIRTLNLTVKPKSFSTINAAICSGQNYAGHTSAGTYIDTLVTVNGCDSIRTLNLSIKPRSFSTIDTAICSGQNYGGHTTAGVYTDVFVAANGCDSVRTLNLSIKNNCTIYIPNAFTPDKNGLNDLFKPYINLPLKKFSFIVFNRYGEKIFETYEYGRGWDGTYKGKEQSTGSYVYRITFINASGMESEYNGTVLLIR